MMAWKGLKQRSLADALQTSNRFVEEFDEIDALLDWSRVEALFCSIHARVKGEKAKIGDKTTHRQFVVRFAHFTTNWLCYVLPLCCALFFLLVAEVNAKVSIKYLEPAAEMGDALAQVTLANMYFDGKEIQKDYQKSAYWYKKAADLGDEEAQLALGRMHSQGLGVGKNHQQALFWYIKAAEQNNVDAQYLVGKSYAEGLGTGANWSLANQWLVKAEKAGSVDAKNYLRRKGVRDRLNKAIAVRPVTIPVLNSIVKLRTQYSRDYNLLTSDEKQKFDATVESVVQSHAPELITENLSLLDGFQGYNRLSNWKHEYNGLIRKLNDRQVHAINEIAQLHRALLSIPLNDSIRSGHESAVKGLGVSLAAYEASKEYEVQLQKKMAGAYNDPRFSLAKAERDSYRLIFLNNAQKEHWDNAMAAADRAEAAAKKILDVLERSVSNEGAAEGQ